MKRFWLLIAAGIAAFALLVFLGLAWLLDTGSGARFALTTLGRLTGVKVSVQRVEGRLRDRLRLEGVAITRSKVVVQVDRLNLAWDPHRLLRGRLMVHEFALSGVRIQDDTPLSAKAPDFRWPKVSETVRRMDVTVTRFALRGLSYRHLQGEPSGLKELAASLTLKDGLLAVAGGSISADRGSASGELVAGLLRPSLRLDLRLIPAQAIADLDAFSVQARLTQGASPEQLAGSLALAGTGKGAQRLELNTELGVTNTGFNFRKMRLVRPGRSGTLTGNGSMTLTQSEPLFSLALAATDLDLSKELDHPARISGTLLFSGTPAAYLGKFSLANEGEGWEKAMLAADYRGGKDGVKLAPLSGKWLKGSVSGVLDIAWKEGVRVSGALSGRKLDPAQLAAQWSGMVNLDLKGVLQVPEEGELRGSVDARFLESRLQGRELRGELVGNFVGARVVVQRLILAGKGFSMRGAGELARRFDFAAKVSDLSGLVPAATGALQTRGWLRWRDGMLSGALTGNGSNIAASGARLGTVGLSASLGEGAGSPVHLKASIADLRVGRARAETALLTLQGSAERHGIDVELSSRGARVQTALSGGYADGVWRGRIDRLSGTDAVGLFNLAAPATLVLGKGRVLLSPLVVVGAPGERVELSADLQPRRAGQLRAGWSALNLSRANLWLEGIELSGASSGEVGLQQFPDGTVGLTGRLDARGTLASDGQRVALERLLATLEGGPSGVRLAAELALEGGAGKAQLDFRSPEPARLSLPERGQLSLTWSDLDLALLRPMFPPEVLLQGRVAGKVDGRLLPGTRFDLSGEANLAAGHLNWLSKGEEFDLSLDQAVLNFGWLDRAAGKRRGELTLTGRAAASGTYTSNGERVLVANSTLRIDADPRGSRAAVNLALEEGGTLAASFISDAPADLAIPVSGDLSLQWSGVRPQLLRPWLPVSLDLQGELHGQANGKLLPGQRLELAGEAGFSQGRASWQGGNGQLSANLRSATLAFAWRGETLSGDLSMALAQYGAAQGNFLLPIPARFPVAPRQDGALQGALAGKVQEKGFLTILVPGLVQESHGKLDLDLKLAGVWQKPRLTGRVQLDEAGAYLPSAGITLTGVQLLAQLEEDQIRVERFRAQSGGGELAGTLLMQLKGWQVAAYSGTLSGQDFQTVYLPELRMFTSPQLSFQGEGRRVTLRGDVGIPEMLISGQPARQVVNPSSDVVFEGAPARAGESEFPLLLEGKVRVVLGDKVRVEASGIDARLTGSMDLVLNGIDNISSSGEIRVAEGGRYRAYGMELAIVRGRLYYVNDPVERPSLDILALRTVGEVSAGVTVAGYLDAPVVKLYSEPAMPEVDILAYMVLGHPMGSSGEQGSLLATAAASLFSFGKSESLQDEIKDRLGLSTLGIETVDTAQSGRMGYKELPTTPGAGAQEPVGQSLFTVGKYLTPKLYLSYGRSLVSGENLFRLRYDLHKRWQVETQSGSESGADLYYKMEFN